MKKYFTIFLIICFLLNIFGCYTNNQILRKDYSNIMAEVGKELQIKLTDGRTIISKEYEHIEVREPSEFIFGKADIIDGRNLQTDVGTILYESEIDSTDKKYYADKSLICWSDGKRYHFSSENYFYITKDSAAGFWVKGMITESESSFYGRLNPSEISNIEVIKIDAVNTTFFVAGIIVVMAIIVYVVALTTNPVSVDLSGMKVVNEQ